MERWISFNNTSKPGPQIQGTALAQAQNQSEGAQKAPQRHAGRRSDTKKPRSEGEKGKTPTSSSQNTSLEDRTLATSEQPHLQLLPAELQLPITALLSLKDQIALYETCRHFASIVSDTSTFFGRIRPLLKLIRETEIGLHANSQSSTNLKSIEIIRFSTGIKVQDKRKFDAERKKDLLDRALTAETIEAVDKKETSWMASSYSTKLRDYVNQIYLKSVEGTHFCSAHLSKSSINDTHNSFKTLQSYALKFSPGFALQQGSFDPEKDKEFLSKFQNEVASTKNLLLTMDAEKRDLFLDCFIIAESTSAEEFPPNFNSLLSLRTLLLCPLPNADQKQVELIDSLIISRMEVISKAMEEKTNLTTSHLSAATLNYLNPSSNSNAPDIPVTEDPDPQLLICTDPSSNLLKLNYVLPRR